jgi:hypothetical protein
MAQTLWNKCYAQPQYYAQARPTVAIRSLFCRTGCERPVPTRHVVYKTLDLQNTSALAVQVL